MNTVTQNYINIDGKIRLTRLLTFVFEHQGCGRVRRKKNSSKPVAWGVCGVCSSRSVVWGSVCAMSNSRPVVWIECVAIYICCGVSVWGV